MSKASVADTVREWRCVPLGLTQCRSSLSVCAQEKAGLICLRLCVGRRKSRCVVVFVLQLQITNNYNNLASIRVGSSAKPAILQHVSFIFLSVSADAAWLKCAPSRGKSIGVSGSRMSFDTFFNNILMHYVKFLIEFHIFFQNQFF